MSDRITVSVTGTPEAIAALFEDFETRAIKRTTAINRLLHVCVTPDETIISPDDLMLAALAKGYSAK